jgi:hypothetical protein
MRFTETLASQAAMVLTKQRLISELKKMFESLIQLIATAIDGDEKTYAPPFRYISSSSPYEACAIRGFDALFIPHSVPPYGLR